MKPKTLRLVDYLDHITQAIERIETYVADMVETAFLDSSLVQDAVLRNIEIIGEASRKVETGFPAFAQAHPELPLAVAYQMRNVVAHGYFKVDLELVWKTIHRDLPELHKMVLAARHQAAQDPQNPQGQAPD